MLLNSNINLLIFLIIFAWLGAISFFGFRFLSSFRKLTKDVSDKNLKDLLEDVLKKIDLTNKENQKITEKISEMEEKDFFHLQKVGLVRYNPFSDTGGDQSFVLAVLDGNDNGVVITSLHSREQTRVYTKPVENGKEAGFEFSKEEIEAIVRAKKGSKKF